jgi:hypothetical protein
MLPLRVSFHASWSIDGNLVLLLEKLFRAKWNGEQRELLVHTDNASAHNSGMTQNFFRHNPLTRLLHPPCSPDISPSDFYLFGKVKNALIVGEIPDEIDLLEAVTEALNGISGAELQCVFQSWSKRVETMIDARGNYLTE